MKLFEITEEFGRDWDKAFQKWEDVTMDRGWHVEHNDTGRAEYEMTVNRDDNKNFIVTVDPSGGGSISSMQGGRGRAFTEFNPEEIADMIAGMK